MTEAQLDAIETALRVTLPAEYRRISAAFPFRPIAAWDGMDWFFNDPERVIAETLNPLNEYYDRADWRDTYVVIGYSGAGDVYLLDTVSAPPLPVRCLSHESRRVEPEWPTFAAFVEYFLVKAPEEDARQREAERAAIRTWRRRAWRVMGLIGFLAIVLPMLVLLVLILLNPRR